MTECDVCANQRDLECSKENSMVELETYIIDYLYSQIDYV